MVRLCFRSAVLVSHSIHYVDKHMWKRIISSICLISQPWKPKAVLRFIVHFVFYLLSPERDTVGVCLLTVTSPAHKDTDRIE